METSQLDVEVQNSQTPVTKGRNLERKVKTSLPSRFTRSQIVPDWTIKEMLVLVNEVAAVNDDCLKTLSSNQRWKMISDNCMALDVNRSSNQCRRQWESMLAEYKKISDWESQSGVGSYWCLESEKKKEYGLPTFFDKELFGALYDFIKDQEAQPDSDMDSESEGLIRKIKTAMHDAGVDLGLKRAVRSRPHKSNINKVQETASKLRENSQLVQAILRGELSETSGRSLDSNDPNYKMEFARKQGDELIKVFCNLVGNLNQLVELVKED